MVDKKYGFRVSAASWADLAYGSLDNRNNATANTLVNGVPTAGALSPYTERFAKGPSGEFLDAFVFVNFELGSMPVNVRAGRHTVYWGESLLGGGAMHGISYGQYSLDLWKGYGTPGVEAKELYRPRESITAQIQPTPELTLAAQTFFDWESARYPESGSYLTVHDALLHGGQSLHHRPEPAPAARRGRHAQEERRLRPVGALESRVARRHRRPVLPPHRRHPAAAGRGARGGRRARRHLQRAGQHVAGAFHLLHQPGGRDGVADPGRLDRPVPCVLRPRHRHLRPEPEPEHRGHQRRQPN